MHTIKLKIEDRVFDKVIRFLRNLPKNEVEIIEEKADVKGNICEDQMETRIFSEHSANLVEDWKDENEDAIWK